LRFSTLSLTLCAALVAAILTLSLLPPTVTTPPALSNILPAKRALILNSILSGYVTINEGADHIVAVSKSALGWAMSEPINRIFPALGRIPITGTNDILDPEQALWLQPDVIFVGNWDGRVLQKLELPGLVEIKNDWQNPVQSREEIWKLIGDATGKSVRAQALAERYAVKREALQRYFSSGAERRVRVVYVHIDQGAWWVTASHYYLAYKLELAGAINASKDLEFTGRADLEQLLLIDPDVILLATNPGDHTTMREVACQPELRSLRAVRERRIYKLPEHTYMNEPVEDPLLLTWMTEIFYPDVMPSNLRYEYKETYWEVYNYAISDDEIDRAIYLEENRYSAGYERFMRKSSS
jgi:iron complex transport system substrate-binding protein